MNQGYFVKLQQPLEKVSLGAVCHAEFISASRKINKLGDPDLFYLPKLVVYFYV